MDKFLNQAWPISSQPESFQNHIKSLNEQNQTQLNSAINRAKINETLNKVNRILNSTTANSLRSDSTNNSTQFTTTSTSLPQIHLPEFNLSKRENLKFINRDLTEKQAKLKSSLDSVIQQINTPFSRKNEIYFNEIKAQLEFQKKPVVSADATKNGKIVNEYIREKLKEEDLSLQDFRYLCLVVKVLEGKPARLDSVLYRDKLD